MNYMAIKNEKYHNIVSSFTTPLAFDANGKWKLPLCGLFGYIPRLCTSASSSQKKGTQATYPSWSSSKGVDYSLIWPRRGCAAEQGMALWVLRLKQDNCHIVSLKVLTGNSVCEMKWIRVRSIVLNRVVKWMIFVL